MSFPLTSVVFFRLFTARANVLGTSILQPTCHVVAALRKRWRDSWKTVIHGDPESRMLLKSDSLGIKEASRYSCLLDLTSLPNHITFEQCLTKPTFSPKKTLTKISQSSVLFCQTVINIYKQSFDFSPGRTWYTNLNGVGQVGDVFQKTARS